MIIIIIVIIFIWHGIICWYINLLQLNLPNVPDANAAPVWSVAKTLLLNKFRGGAHPSFAKYWGWTHIKISLTLLLLCFSAQLHLQLIYQTFPFLHSKETFWHICKFDLSLESILLFQMKTNRKLVVKRQNRGKKTKITFNVFVFLLLLSCLLIILINRSALKTLKSKSVTTSQIKFSGTSKKRKY